MNRREAIRRTLLFSSAIIGGDHLIRQYSHGAEPLIEPGGMHFLAFGDFGTANCEQRKVADAMADFADKLGTPLSGVLALGDNFYGPFTDDRFRTGFEEMYDRYALPCPFYACLGNHDYEPISGEAGHTKADAELRYAAERPWSRWKMPARWYVVELPDAENPLVRMIFLDGNRAQMGEEAFAEQTRFLEREASRETKARWTWIANHYPMFTEGTKRGDNRKLAREWGHFLTESNASLFLSGHDHNLQHLQVGGYDTSFLISGGGGRSLDEVRDCGRGFSHSGLGFHHIRVDETSLTVQILDEKGKRLHAFRRPLQGKVAAV